MNARRIAAGIVMTATLALAGPPGKDLTIDNNWQQLQPIEALRFQQGASVRLMVHPKLSGASIDLTGMTARWEARPTLATNAALQALSTYTSNTAHTIAIDLSSTQTGTPVTNWIYSIILTHGGLDYPVGTGRVDIIESGFTGGPAVLVNNQTAVLTNDAAYLAALTNIAAGSGISLARTGRTVTVSATTSGLSGSRAFRVFSETGNVYEDHAATFSSGLLSSWSVTTNHSELVLNQFFSSTNFWTWGAGWSQFIESAMFGGVTNSMLSQAIMYPVRYGKTYRVTIECSGTGAGGQISYMCAKLGTNAVTVTDQDHTATPVSADILYTGSSGHQTLSLYTSGAVTSAWSITSCSLQEQ